MKSLGEMLLKDLFHLLFIYFTLINGYPDGNIPLSACENMTPQHGPAAPREERNPYNISVSFETFLPSREIEGIYKLELMSRKNVINHLTRDYLQRRKV